MQRTSINLNDEQMLALKRLAAEERTTVADLVRRAIDSYLATLPTDRRRWQANLDDFLSRLSDLPCPVASPDELEADVTAAREEARAARRTTGRR